MKQIFKSKIFWISLLTAIVTLLFCSKCSFLYTFNSWCDVNCFMTVGKSMMKGKVLYKDIYEQKGLLLFLIYGLSSLVSKTTFYPIFFVEVLCDTFFIYFVYKTATLFTKKVSWVFIPIINALVYSSMFFAVGGGAEEFAMPFLAYAFYAFCEYHLNDEDNKSRIEYSKIMLLGISAAFIFWNKYTVLGLIAGLLIALVYDYIIGKHFKEVLVSAVYFILGWALISIPCLLYFAANNALLDLWKGYFYDNIFIYGDVPSSMVPSVYQVLRSPIAMVIMAVAIIILIIMFMTNKSKFLELLRKKKMRLGIELGIIILFTLVSTVGLGRIYKYYILPLTVFSSLFIVLATKLLNRIEIKRIWIKNILTTCICLGLIPYMLMVSLSTPDLFKPHKEMVQYQFADTIKKTKNATLLTYDWLDDGFYFAANIEPNCKYFHGYNIPLKEIKNEQHSKMNNRQITFVASMNSEVDKIIPQYKKVQEGQQDDQHWYLYKLK
ncbi:MAG: hypothetical protein IJF94_02700 [Eubacterium sp.]|nr:hypothetical protein [Eubacterium sp.]